MREDKGSDSGGDALAASPGGQPGIDPLWLSATIGMIYDCVLAPDRWSRVIEAICHQFSFASGALGVVQSRPAGAHQLVSHYGLDTEWMAVVNSYISDSISLWGGPARIANYPLEEPIIFSEVSPRAQWADNRYYRDILKPRGLTEAATIALVRDAHVNGYVGLNRHASAGAIRLQDREGLRLLAPHMRRAITIADLLDLNGLERATFRSVLDGIRSAVILVSEDLDVIHTNAAADHMLAHGAPFAVTRGRLDLSDEPAKKALTSAVRVAAENEVLLQRRGLGIPLKSHDGGAAAILHVMPLYRGEIRAGLVQRAVAGVFVAVSDVINQTSVDAISLLYELSPAESAVFAGISQGRSISESATDIGIAKSTARTHLLRVFEKTGCKRQAELVALAAQLSPRV